MDATKRAGRGYLWARACLVAGALLVLGGIAGMAVEWRDSGGLLPRWSLLPFVLGLPACFLLVNLEVFRFPYSVFGKRRKTPLPDRAPFYQRSGTSFRVGRFGGGGPPFFSWYVYPDGIGFAGFGEGFVPKEQIRSVALRRRKGLIEHVSPEVRSPLVVPLKVAEYASDFESIPRPAERMSRWIGGRKKLHRLGIVVLVLVGGLVGTGYDYLLRMEDREADARDEVHRFLREAGSKAVLIVDGMHLTGTRSREVLGLLRKMGHGPRLFCSGMRSFPVVVHHGAETLDLEMARDTRRPTYYWVFLPAELPQGAEIGRIRTDALDDVTTSD